MKKQLFRVLFFLIICAAYLLWNKTTALKSDKDFDKLKITVENVSSTKATLKFTHPDSSVLKNYRIMDDCYFILKKTGFHPNYVKNFDATKLKKDAALTVNSDSSAICEKNWEHLYGTLDSGEYMMGIAIGEKKFFKTRNFRPIRVKIQIP